MSSSDPNQFGLDPDLAARLSGYLQGVHLKGAILRDPHELTAALEAGFGVVTHAIALHAGTHAVVVFRDHAGELQVRSGRILCDVRTTQQAVDARVAGRPVLLQPDGSWVVQLASAMACGEVLGDRVTVRIIIEVMDMGAAAFLAGHKAYAV